MRAKLTGSGRGSSRRIPSTIRKGSTPPPPRISSRIRSSPLRRRSRSPRPPRKSTMPRSPIKRRLSLSPKRSIGRKTRDDVRLPPKRPRDLPKDRRPTPGKKYLNKPPYEDPRKEITYNKELKNIKINVQRDFLGESKRIERTVVHPEDVAIVRRPVEDHRGRGYVGMENGRYPRPAPMPPRPHRHVTGRGRDGQGEGSTPIFNRQEIIENKRKYDEDLVIPSHSDRLHNEPSTSYSDNFRIIRDDLDKERDRMVNNSGRSPRGYDYKPRDFRSREDLRYPLPSTSTLRSRSFDRSRDYLPERKERYDDRDIHRGPRRSLEKDRVPRRSPERDRGSRRSLDRERGRSDDRLPRRHPSPDVRRHFDQFRDYEDRRTRSLERRDLDSSHFRDHHDYPPGDRFSGTDHSGKSRAYYEVGGREHPSPSPRGRGAGGPYSRGRGGGFPGRPFIRNAGFAVRPVPAERALRGLPVARLPVIARRLPFPPRKSSRGSLQPRR